MYSFLMCSKGLDALMQGLAQTDLIVVARKPGAGKSAVVHNIIIYEAWENHPILICPPEMNKEFVLLHLLSMESDASIKRLGCGELGETLRVPPLFGSMARICFFWKVKRGKVRKMTRQLWIFIDQVQKSPTRE